MQNSQLNYYTGFTLVDITATGVTRTGNEHRRNQQRNWETVLQTIGLAAQPVEIQGPITSTVDLDYLEFGEMYSGEKTVWMWTFAVESADVFLTNDNPVGRLEQFFEQVPIICGLDETAHFMLPIFYPYGAIKNIYFKTGAKDISNI